MIDGLEVLLMLGLAFYTFFADGPDLLKGLDEA